MVAFDSVLAYAMNAEGHKKHTHTRTHKGTKKPNVRLRRCTCVHCTGYGANAVYSSSLMSCPFCVWGAAECHGSRKQSPPSPKGVTPAAARTILFLVLPMRSCREGPEHFDPTLLAFFGFPSSRRVTPFSRVTEGINPPAC